MTLTDYQKDAVYTLIFEMFSEVILEFVKRRNLQTLLSKML